VLNLLKKAGTARLFVAALALVLVAALVALTVDLRPGSAELPDAADKARAPIAETVDGRAAAEADMRRLSAHLEKQPRDARAWVILARLQAEMDRFEAAAQAYEKALALQSKVANDPAVWCEYADALGMTQGGKLDGKPRELIDRALALNPNHPKALEMAGSAAYEARDHASAARYWRELLAQIPARTREHGELAAAIDRADERARTR